jgi:hypothetical protein
MMRNLDRMTGHGISRIRGWSLRLALAVIDDQPGVAQMYGAMIVRLLTDPGSKMPGLRLLGWGARSLDQHMTMLMDAAVEARGARADRNVDGDQLLADAIALLPRVAPEAALADAQADVRASRTGAAPSETIGAIYANAALLAVMLRHPWLAPNPAGYRRLILREALECDALAGGMPMVEGVVVPTDDEVIARISDAETAIGTITADPARRTLVELDLLESVRALMMEHPEHDAVSDLMIHDLAGRILSADGIASVTHRADVAQGRSSPAARQRNQNPKKKKKRRR